MNKFSLSFSLYSFSLFSVPLLSLGLFSIGLFSFVLVPLHSHSQPKAFSPKAYTKKIKTARKKKDKEFKKGVGSPLSLKAQKKFRKLNYYPINLAYRVKARMELTPDTEFFTMPTSDGKVKKYRQYALLYFQLQGKEMTLPIYRNRSLMRIPKYRNYLLIPFTDLTNGVATYGAGRYMEFYLQKNPPKEIILDFNTAYNPYCAYSPHFSCPIPPQANHLNIKVEAGEKKFEK